MMLTEILGDTPNGRLYKALVEKKLAARAGEVVGVSGWIEIDQKRISAFADATEDWQFIHVDPEAAAKTPFGGTIAHGFLTLSLFIPMWSSLLEVTDATTFINYGLDKVRFMTPVKAGARVRNRVTLASVEAKGGGRIIVKTMNELQIEGEEKPALIAETLAMLVSQA